MALTSPPVAPQRGDRATFSPRMDAFLLWLVALIPQLNAFLSSITTLAAGGANSFSYVFDAATADTDPGPGKLRLGSTTQNGSVVIRLDNNPATGGDVTAFLTALQAGTSNIKGSVRLQRVTDATVWMLFDITSVSSVPTYSNLTVVPRSSSSTSPFAADDTLVAFFDLKGDKGDGGNTPTQAEMLAAVGTLPVANGGTGATTAAGARTALGVPAATAVINKGSATDSAGTRLRSTLAPKIDSITSSGQTDNVPLIISNGANNEASAVVQFIRDGVYGAYFGLDTDNKWKVGGFSMGPVAYELFHQGNFNPANYAAKTGATFTGNVTAPAFIATSDESLKENWRAAPDDFLEKFAAIERAGLFDWSASGCTDGGIGAQSIQEIAPWCVHEIDGLLRVNYNALNTVVVHALARRVLRDGAAR